MQNEARRRGRALVVWAVVTAAAGAVLAAAADPVLALGRLRADDPAALADVLVAGFAAVGAVAAVALWWTTTDVALALLRGTPDESERLGTGPLRRIVLAACGVAVLHGLGATHAAQAAPEPSLDGLPLPDRATGAVTVADPADVPRTDRRIVVRTGDSLWHLSRTASGPHASDADVAEHVERLYRHNRDRIGDDADLIHPGQVLELPEDGPD